MLPCFVRSGFLLAILFFVISAPLQARKPTPTPTPTPPPVAIPHPNQYFFSVDIDARYQIVGHGMLSEVQAELANHYRFTFNTDGKVTRIEYFRTVAHPDNDPYFSVNRIDFSYSEDPATHRKVERRAYGDTAGNPIHNAFGEAIEELHLNPAGGVEDIFNQDEHSQPINDNEGVYHYARKLDDRNRVIVLKRFALTGILEHQETQITDKDGYYETRTSYDEEDRPIQYANYDSNGALLKNRDGIATVRTVYTIFPDFTKVEESYFDPDGLPVYDPRGIHMKTSLVDKRDFVVQETYADERGAAVLDKEILTGETPLASYDFLHVFKDLPDESDHIHGRNYTFDDLGNLVDIQYLGLDNKPKEVKSTGYAEIRNSYDDQNRIIEQDFLGDDGNPVENRQLGIAVLTQQYGPDGNVVACQFFDGLRHPVNHEKFGAPAITIKYNAADGRNDIALQNAQGQPMANEAGGGFYSLSYRIADDQPLAGHNHNTFYDAKGRRLTRLNIYFNKFLFAMDREYYTQLSARLGAGSTALGALIAAWMNLRKARAAARKRAFMPRPIPRVLALIAFYFIGEGIIRFTCAIYWYKVEIYPVNIDFSRVYFFEVCFFVYFVSRLYRMSRSLRVYNIALDELKKLITTFFTENSVELKIIDKPLTFTSQPLTIWVRYFKTKRHAALNLMHVGEAGAALRKKLVTYLRAQVRKLRSPQRGLLFLLYYPLQTLAYTILLAISLSTLWFLLPH